jgi:ribosomal protein L11 methylase PrmA
MIIETSGVLNGRLIRNGCLGIDGLDIDPHAVSAPLDAAFEDIASAASGRIQ